MGHALVSVAHFLNPHRRLFVLRDSIWHRSRPFLFAAILIAIWELGIRHLGSSTVLPSPFAVLKAMAELMQHGLLIRYCVASLFRVTWGFALATVCAVPLGLAIGALPRVEIALQPVMQILRPLSPLAWIPIAILWFGVGDMAAIFLLFLGCFFPLLTLTVNAVHTIPAIYLEAGRNFGLGGASLAYQVVLPSIMPQLLAGLRLTLGVAWLVVVAAEMIAVNSGLGFLIVDARNAGNRYDLVVAGMIAIGVIGLLLDRGMRSLERLPFVAWAYAHDTI